MLSPPFISHITWASVVDVSDDSWTTKAPMNYARANLGVVAVNGKIYAIGGDVGSIFGNCVTIKTMSATVSTNEEYDPITNAWTVKASMPTNRALFGIAAYNDKIYCIGGYTTTEYTNEWGGSSYSYEATKCNEVYDPAKDSWATMAPLSEPLSQIQANTVENKIYVTASGSTLLYVYNTVTNSWTQKTPAPLQVANFASAVIDHKIITIGRTTEYQYYLQTYDPGFPLLHHYVGGSTPRVL